MLLPLLLMYCSVLVGAMLSTVLLILFGRSWGPLPSYYLRGVRRLQNLFPSVYPKSDSHWPAIIDKNPSNRLQRWKNSSSATFKFLDQSNDVWNILNDCTHSGIEAIIQDDLSPAFDHCPSYAETLMRWTPLPQWNPAQKTVFYLTLVFRVFFLFPVRLSLFISSFVFISLACVVSFITVLSEKDKAWISVVYCRLFCAGLGVVANYRNRQNTPKAPGVAVSNHITPNDIQILYAGTPHGWNFPGYVVTGQKHSGIIGVIETLVSRLNPALWLERKDPRERSDFLEQVLETAKTGGPILLFPEGYCTNNTRVLQFRKAVFEADIDIHPISIRQDGHFGDSYWFEDKFHMYLLRVMLSWAIQYDVNYLDKMRRELGEANSEFAARVETAVANGADIPRTCFDGGVWYKKPEQERMLSMQQLRIGDILRSRLRPSESSSDAEEEGFCLVEPLPEVRRTEITVY